MGCTVPVLFIVFNRTDTAERVLNRLREVQAEKIYIAADGPRPDKNEIQECEAARNLIRKIDWPCEVKTFFPEHNSGPRKFIGDAVSWLFSFEEKGIILEHDCLPHPDFFPYCESMLEWYAEDTRVMHISGIQFQDIGRSVPEIYFSHYNHIWGWATWKRAWKYYDLGMSLFPEFEKAEKIKNIFPEKAEQKYWLKKMKEAYSGKIGSWDYQWTFALWNQQAVSVIPGSNLVSNIGFGAGAIHTTDASHFLADRPVYDFPVHILKKPADIQISRSSEKYDFRKVFYPGFIKRFMNWLKA